MAEFLKIEDAISNLDVKDSMLAAEFGCGSAHFTIALAKKLKMGRVYALDVQEQSLSALKGKLNHEKIHNVLPTLCNFEIEKGTKLRDGFLDIVLIPNTLFQSDDKSSIIKEAGRVLKTGGQLLVIDWLAGGPFSPKAGLVSPDEVKKIAADFGFSLKKEFAAGDYHYGLLFIKN